MMKQHGRKTAEPNFSAQKLNNIFTPASLARHGLKQRRSVDLHPSSALQLRSAHGKNLKTGFDGKGLPSLPVKCPFLCRNEVERHCKLARASLPVKGLTALPVKCPFLCRNEVERHCKLARASLPVKCPSKMKKYYHELSFIQILSWFILSIKKCRSEFIGSARIHSLFFSPEQRAFRQQAL